MSTALVKAGERDLCGLCGARLICGFCSVGDVVQSARVAIAEIVKSRSPPRGATARLLAAKIILAKDFLAYLSDEDLLAEVRRRTEAKKL